MSKDETDNYKTLVSNLENELKSKGEKFLRNENGCREVKLYPLLFRKQKFHARGGDSVSPAQAGQEGQRDPEAREGTS